MPHGYEKREKFVLEGGCPVKAFEEANVTVPVTVCAKCKVGDVDFHCCGDPVITKNSDYTPGRPDAVSKFTIRQKMRVDIPIVFGLETDIGEGHVDFDIDKEKGGCHKCEKC